MNTKEFSKELKDKSESLQKDLELFLLKTRFELERKGKENATEDFYAPVTRSGFERDYPLTGNLRRSINSKIEKTSKGINLLLQAGGFLGGRSVDYADDLEFGTSDIKPYFFLGRAVKEQQEDLTGSLKEFLKIELLLKEVKK